MRLTIDELAQRTGTSSRNIRAYQAKGLLPGPQLEGRTGYYVEDTRDQIFNVKKRRTILPDFYKCCLHARENPSDFAEDYIAYRRSVSRAFDVKLGNDAVLYDRYASFF